MEQKIVIIGTGSVDVNIIQTLKTQRYSDVIVVDSEKEKEQKVAFQPEPIPYVSRGLPQINYELYKECAERKNFINGKKLPRKKQGKKWNR